MARHDWMECTHIFTFCEVGHWKMLVRLWFEPAVLLKAFVKKKKKKHFNFNLKKW